MGNDSFNANALLGQAAAAILRNACKWQRRFIERIDGFRTLDRKIFQQGREYFYGDQLPKLRVERRRRGPSHSNLSADQLFRREIGITSCKGMKSVTARNQIE